MRASFATLAFLSALYASTSAHAAVTYIDFSVYGHANDISYSGQSVDQALNINTSGDLNGTVNGVGVDEQGNTNGPNDDVTNGNGSAFNAIIVPKNIVFTRNGSLNTYGGNTVTWSAVNGSQTFTYAESFNALPFVDHSQFGQITLDFTGEVTDTVNGVQGLFNDTPATASLTFYQDFNNPGQISEWSFANNASVGVADVAVATPEASTWAMMLMGFAGMGYMGYKAHTAKAAF